MSLAGAIRAGRAFIALGLDDTELRTALNRLRGRLNTLGAAIGNVGGGLLAAGSGIMAALAFPVTLAANLEVSHAAFTTLLKDGDKAQTLLDQLQQFAASTPFQFPELADAARTLISFGGSADTVVDELRMLGDIAAGIQAPLGDVATIFGKIRTDGRVMGDDLTQLGGRGIPILQGLADVLGVDAKQVRKLASEGKVGFKDVEKAFQNLTAEGGLFAGGMERASKTLKGLWSTLIDNVAAAVLPIGQELLPMLGAAANEFTSIAKVVGVFIKQNKDLATTVAGVAVGLVSVGATLVAVGGGLYVLTLAAGGIAAAFGIALATFSSLIGVASALALPIGAVVVAITAARTAGVDLGAAWRASLDGLAALFGPIASAASEVGTAIGADFAAATETVISAWASVVSALSRGDAEAAIAIVTAALEVAWLQATFSIQNYWSDLVGGIRDKWTDAITYISKLGVTLVTVLQNAFASVKTYIVGIIDSIITRISQAIAYLTLHGGRARQAMDDIKTDAGKRAEGRGEALQKQLEANSNAAADYFNTLDAMATEEKAARQTSKNAAVTAAEERLRQARLDLQGIQAEETAAANKAKEEKKKDTPGAADAAAATAKAIGAFSAAAIARQVGGGDSLAIRTAKATEKTADNTAKLAAKDFGVTFA